MLANLWRIVVITAKSAMNRDVSLLAAGLAFFALISMAPFLIIAVSPTSSRPSPRAPASSARSPSRPS